MSVLGKLGGREIHDAPSSSKKRQVISREELENSKHPSVQTSDFTDGDEGTTILPEEPNFANNANKEVQRENAIDTPDTTVLGMETFSGDLYDSEDDVPATDVISDYSEQDPPETDVISDYSETDSVHAVNQVSDNKKKDTSNDLAEPVSIDDDDKSFEQNMEQVPGTFVVEQTTKSQSLDENNSLEPTNEDTDEGTVVLSEDDQDTDKQTVSCTPSQAIEELPLNEGINSNQDKHNVDNSNSAGPVSINSRCKHRYLLTKISNGQEVLINKPRFIIGKSKFSDYQVTNTTTVSRSHAIVAIEKNEIYLEDNDSKNGTSVDGVYLRSHDKVKLKNGSIIRLSDEEFKLTILDR